MARPYRVAARTMFDHKEMSSPGERGPGFRERNRGGQDMPAHTELARAMYRAYETGDRSAIESLIAERFEFWSPLDDGIDRETYFERCWANHDSIVAIELLRVAELSESEVVATYQLVKQDGSRGQNTEIITFDGDRATK